MIAALIEKLSLEYDATNHLGTPSNTHLFRPKPLILQRLTRRRPLPQTEC